MSHTLTDQDYAWAAEQLKCTVAHIKAVAQVEAGGHGFLPDGQPKILFERHIFSRLTNHVWDTRYPSISNRAAGGYIGGASEQKRLDMAATLDRNAALMAASWGKFQILGLNWQLCGAPNLQFFINKAYEGERGHLEMFVGFLLGTGLAAKLRANAFAEFARGYNGPGYRKYEYDSKIRKAYIAFGGRHE